jgi:hypothetical protein
MKLRKHVVGAGSGGFVKFLIGAVLFFVLVPKLLQCAQEAPRRLADAASKRANSAVDSITNAPRRWADGMSKEADAVAQSIGDSANSAIRSTAQTAENVKCRATGSPCTAADAPPNAPPPPAPPVNTAAQPANSQCLTLDKALTNALFQARGYTRCSYLNNNEQEYSGFVYSEQRGKQMCYAFTEPSSGSAKWATTDWDPARHPDQVIAAHYHAHPHDASARFSAMDFCNYVANEEIGYVVATANVDTSHDGDVKKFTPTEGQYFPYDVDSNFHLCVFKFSPANLWDSLRAAVVCTFLESNYDDGVTTGTIKTYPSAVPARDFADCPASTLPDPSASSGTGGPDRTAVKNLYDRCTNHVSQPVYTPYQDCLAKAVTSIGRGGTAANLCSITYARTQQEWETCMQGVLCRPDEGVYKATEGCDALNACNQLQRTSGVSQ